jgi:predicted secreted protein
MFDDQRSKKVVFLAHCILNQNAKLDCCAYFPGTVKTIVDFFQEKGVGIVQLPCPEVLFLGLQRGRDCAKDASIKDEDTRISGLMRNEETAGKCVELTKAVCHQIQEYRENSFQVMGVVGINGSPTCGVETNWRDGFEAPGKGVYMAALEGELRKKKSEVPFAGIKVYEMESAMTKIQRLLS